MPTQKTIEKRMGRVQNAPRPPTPAQQWEETQKQTVLLERIAVALEGGDKQRVNWNSTPETPAPEPQDSPNNYGGKKPDKPKPADEAKSDWVVEKTPDADKEGHSDWHVEEMPKPAVPRPEPAKKGGK